MFKQNETTSNRWLINMVCRKCFRSLSRVKLKMDSKRHFYRLGLAFGGIVTLLVYCHLQTNLTQELGNMSTLQTRTNDKLRLASTREDTLYKHLHEHIRITCFVMTQPKNHKDQARTVGATWGRRCNHLYFVSTAPVENATTAIYKGKESQDILWGKTKLGFRYAYDNHFDEAEWFVKADDDTYMIMENLRFLLLDKDPSKPTYYRCKFKAPFLQGYMSGGAGYVLSKEALKKLVEKSLPDKTKCRQDDGGYEDLEIEYCLVNVGVESADSRDPKGRVRFFPYTPEDHVAPSKNAPKYDGVRYGWYSRHIWYAHQQGIHCCSEVAISFHYLTHGMMWTMEYLLYHLRPFRIHSQLSEDDLIRQLNREPNWASVNKSTGVAR